MFLAYAAAGFTVGTFSGRLVAIRNGLGFDSAQMGLFILVWAVGSLCLLPLTGLITSRLGARRASRFGAGVVAAGLVLLALTAASGWAVAAVASLWAFGAGYGIWDAAITVEGARVEQRSGHAAMARFQAGESLGTVAGSGLGALAALIHAPLLGHFAVAAALAALGAFIAARSFLPNDDDGARGCRGGACPRPTAALPQNTARQRRDNSARDDDGALAGWREARTLLLGIVIFGAALADGSSANWTSLALVYVWGAPEAVGAFGVALAFTAALLMRLASTWVVDRFGRVAVVRVCCLGTIAGVTLFALAPSLRLALAGTVIWGASGAMGFPLGVSAASDDPARAPMRVATASTIGYLAFLIGPAMIGAIAAQTGYRYALLAITVPALLAFFAAGAAKPLKRDEPVALGIANGGGGLGAG